MLKVIQAKLAKAFFGAAGQAAPSSPLPPPLEPNFDLAAYRQFMCDETHLYRKDYIRDRVQLQGQEHYQAALQKGSVVVVFVHHGSWL